MFKIGMNIYRTEDPQSLIWRNACSYMTISIIKRLANKSFLPALLTANEHETELVIQSSLVINTLHKRKCTTMRIIIPTRRDMLNKRTNKEVCFWSN